MGASVFRSLGETTEEGSGRGLVSGSGESGRRLRNRVEVTPTESSRGDAVFRV